MTRKELMEKIVAVHEQIDAADAHIHLLYRERNFLMQQWKDTEWKETFHQDNKPRAKAAEGVA